MKPVSRVLPNFLGNRLTPCPNDCLLWHILSNYLRFLKDAHNEFIYEHMKGEGLLMLELLIDVVESCHPEDYRFVLHMRTIGIDWVRVP